LFIGAVGTKKPAIGLKSPLRCGYTHGFISRMVN